MDDDSGWHEVLVEGWGELVRAAVCDRVDERFATARGVLAITVVTPDDAPSDAVERVHAAVVGAIAAETGADLDALGSQAAWATYEDVWAELGRRWSSGGPLEAVLPEAVPEVRRTLALLPRDAIEAAGAVVDGLAVRLVRTADGTRLDVEGLHRWLALDEAADERTRQLARAVIAAARRTR